MQGVLEDVERAGYALYAISYDSVEVLAGFAARYGITYPLLSDANSDFIRQLGILNEEANENVFGIPHPGVFVLDGDGTVRSKHFYPSYRERDTGIGVLEHILGIGSGNRAVSAGASSDGIEVRAWLDNDTYAWGQRVWATIELTLPSDLHVYGQPIPEGYYPLEVLFEPIERVTFGEPQFPPAVEFDMEGLDETFHVYEGTVRVQVPVSFMVVDAGTLEVALTVSFQACTSTQCREPESVRLVLPIPERPLVERPQPRA